MNIPSLSEVILYDAARARESGVVCAADFPGGSVLVGDGEEVHSLSDTAASDFLARARANAVAAPDVPMTDVLLHLAGPYVEAFQMVRT